MNGKDWLVEKKSDIITTMADPILNTKNSGTADMLE
jgi:hypothetical protein